MRAARSPGLKPAVCGGREGCSTFAVSIHHPVKRDEEKGKRWSQSPLYENMLPHHVLGYLARYTHRVAITNHRLVAFEQGAAWDGRRAGADRGEGAWRAGD